VGTTTHQIEAHIDATRQALGSNLHELDARLRAAAHWKQHYRSSPATWLGAAFGGGAVLSALFSRRGSSHQCCAPLSPPPQPVSAPPAWSHLKSALLATAATGLLRYASEILLSPRLKSEDSQANPSEWQSPIDQSRQGIKSHEPTQRTTR
jgi:hypothetical protein